MPKIKCPHCGANNQDVTEKDQCWQCDAVLGASAPIVNVESPVPTLTDTVSVQKQIEPTRPAPLPTTSLPQSRFPAAAVAIVIALILIVLAILFFVLKK